MAELSLNWIIIRNLISVNFIIKNNLQDLFLISFNYVLVKSLEDCSAVSHTQIVRAFFLDTRNFILILHLICFSIHILVKSLEGSSAITHTRLACPPDF